MLRLLCWIGLHRRVFTEKWFPSITAPIVSEVIFTTKCGECGKVLERSRLVWNGRDMVDAP